MGRQAIAVTALLAMAGVGVGYLGAQTVGQPAVSSESAEPLPASSPSAPVEGLDLTPDPPQPALEPDLDLVETSFGESPTRLTFPVPRGWKRITNAPNEYRWKIAGHPEDTFVLRVAQVASQKRTIEQLRAERIRRVQEKERAFEVVDQSGDGLEYTYIDDLGHQRHLVVRWLDLVGNPNAEVEINLSGRERDSVGAADLVDRVAARVVQD